jgi:hypothetical protein
MYETSTLLDKTAEEDETLNDHSRSVKDEYDERDGSRRFIYPLLDTCLVFADTTDPV